MTSKLMQSSCFFDIIIFLLPYLVIGPSFMSILLPILELKQTDQKFGNRKFTHLSFIQYVETSTNQGYLKKNNFKAPFYGWVSTVSSLESLQAGSLFFTTKFPQKFLILILSTFKHPVVLNTAALDWESRTLMTRPLLLWHE